MTGSVQHAGQRDRTRNRLIVHAESAVVVPGGRARLDSRNQMAPMQSGAKVLSRSQPTANVLIRHVSPPYPSAQKRLRLDQLHFLDDLHPDLPRPARI